MLMAMMPALWFTPEKTFSRRGATHNAMTETRNGFVKKHKTSGVDVVAFRKRWTGSASSSQRLIIVFAAKILTVDKLTRTRLYQINYVKLVQTRSWNQTGDCCSDKTYKNVNWVKMIAKHANNCD